MQVIFTTVSVFEPERLNKYDQPGISFSQNVSSEALPAVSEKRNQILKMSSSTSLKLAK